MNSEIATPPGALAILCTCPNREQANLIARTLVEEGLAACVNILPGIRSVFFWQGKIEEADELMLIVKAPAENFAALAERVRALHPYSVPEVLALAVADASRSYLEWLLRSGR